MRQTYLLSWTVEYLSLFFVTKNFNDFNSFIFLPNALIIRQRPRLNRMLPPFTVESRPMTDGFFVRSFVVVCRSLPSTHTPWTLCANLGYDIHSAYTLKTEWRYRVWGNQLFAEVTAYYHVKILRLGMVVIGGTRALTNWVLAQANGPPNNVYVVWERIVVNVI